jgi:hypothetical protein
MSPQQGRHRILFGDIHNHNGHGYGVGSIERSIDVARTHLDFFAFTGHMQWHDMQPMEGGREQHWLKGFARLRETWPRVQDAIADANRDGAFNAFLGFEWHSSEYGDQCVVFPRDHRPLHEAPDVPALRRFCVAEDALMIPHHLAYPSGMRGVNWGVFCERCTPVVEIYSEHGNSEDDRGPLPMFSHSMGGRQTSNTVRAALANGLRFGFVASSDTHSGFPGAYGEGLMAALCTDHTRDAIMEAIRARRTYALTGDRIEIDFSVEGAPMGSSIEAGREVEVSYAVRGRDELDVVEVIQDGAVVHRSFAPEATSPDALDAPIQLRLEWGWGPWGALALQRICDWRFEIVAEGAEILRVFPCLQSGPYDEDRRHRFVLKDARQLHVTSYTSRREAYRENPNQSVVLEMRTQAEATLTLRLEAPVAQQTTARIADLLRESYNMRTGPFPKESHQWHRIVPRSASSLEDRCRLAVPRDRRSHIYLRLRQKNGHMAWASPVFLNHR